MRLLIVGTLRGELITAAKIARERGTASVAEDAGLGRASVYKALTPGAEPRFGQDQPPQGIHKRNSGPRLGEVQRPRRMPEGWSPQTRGPCVACAGDHEKPDCRRGDRSCVATEQARHECDDDSIDPVACADPDLFEASQCLGRPQPALDGKVAVSSSAQARPPTRRLVRVTFAARAARACASRRACRGGGRGRARLRSLRARWRRW